MSHFCFHARLAMTLAVLAGMYNPYPADIANTFLQIARGHNDCTIEHEV